MNEFKGTPGPWKVMSDSPEGSEIESEHESAFWAFVSYDTPEAERTPNAQLIAAAPELLAALISVQDAGFESDGSGWGVLHITCEDWESVNKAIGKALGEKP